MINGIEVTDVIIFPVKGNVENGVRAYAKIVLNDQLIICGIKVIKGRHDAFISFPQEYNKNQGKGYDICFPITAELRCYLSDQILSQYDIVMGKEEQKSKNRAELAKIIMLEHDAEYQYRQDTCTAVTDLIVDLLHLAKQDGWSPIEDCLEVAQMHFEHEEEG